MIGLYIIFVGVVYVLLGLFIANRLVRLAIKPFHKTLIALAVVLIFVLIPIWDIILGQLYFKYLCETEGGIKIYKQVILLEKYWDERSNPAFITSVGKFDPEPLNNQYKFINIHQAPDSVAEFLNIEQTVKSIIKTESDEILGQYILFYYFGGWLPNSTGLHGSADVCPPIRAGATRSFINQVFIPNNQGS